MSWLEDARREPTPEEIKAALVGKKFDCDTCGATVGGEWLEKHSNWHDEAERAALPIIYGPLAKSDRPKL